MDNQFQSNALWPAEVCSSMYGDNISTDTHTTEEEAEGVCRGLQHEGFAGEGRHFPIRTWVSGVQDPPVVPPAEPQKR